MRLSKLRSLACVLLVGSMVMPSVCLARKQTEVRYPFEQVWNAALRMVRVDLRLPVTDRDVDAGYLLFEYIDHDKRYPGSFEIVKGERDQRPLIKAVVQVPGMPAYVEQMLLDKLERKLRDEYGEPLTPVKPAPEKPKEPEKKPAADDDDGNPPPPSDEDKPKRK